MTAMSDFLEVEVRKHMFRTGNISAITVLGVSLGTATILDADTGSTGSWEAANSGSYARVDLPPADGNWTGASSTDGLTDNVAAITFPTATGSWGTITDVAICSSATYATGEIYVYGALDASKTVGSGDIFKFATNALKTTFA